MPELLRLLGFPRPVPELPPPELVANEELGFYNLVIGESGAEPDCPPLDYRRRIDNSVNSIKKKFTQLNIAIKHIERDLQMKAPPAGTKENPTPQRKSRSVATKADIRYAVKTILNGEDEDMPKPGPRITEVKYKQIAAAETYKKTHCGCTLRNACVKSFVRERGGYASGLSMYESLRRRMDR